MADVLIIDDDIQTCSLLSDMVKSLGHNATFSLTLKEGLRGLILGSADVVFLDVRLPDGNGLEALPQIREAASSPEIIIITGEGDPDGVELALKNGAWDYLQKPLSPKQITLPISRVLQYRDELKRVQKQTPVLNPVGIVGSSPLMRACLESVAQAADSKANVLITGETGTGKELFARAVHENSRHANNNFVVVDCASLPEQLVESSLFGHQKGAFTGAEKSRDGLIKQADGGTLFLDEVGELTLPLQRAFLRVLQERRFRPVGSKQEVKSSFRLVAATNRKLDHMVKNGQFRKDLLYRLQGVNIELPPLRQRPEDVRELVVHYMTKICRSYGIETKGISPDFFEALYAYKWPGNVRELVSTLEGTITKARREPTLFVKHLPTYIRVHIAKAILDKRPHDPLKESSKENFTSLRIPPRYRDFRESILAEAEKEYFQNLMAFTQGSVKKACQISGLSRSWLYMLMKKYRVSRFGWPSSGISFLFFLFYNNCFF